MCVPRRLIPESGDINDSSLHTFCGASEEAFAQVVYVRNRYRDGGVVVRAVMAKTKVAPKKSVSIPLLELNAALLCSRLMNYAKKSLSDRRKKMTCYIWTDSSCVRNWVRTTAAYYKPYFTEGFEVRPWVPQPK